MHSKGAALCHIRDGKVTKMVLYYDRAVAFADLDVSE
jgi:ketosteroid isomerase-like protein